MARRNHHAHPALGDGLSGDWNGGNGVVSVTGFERPEAYESAGTRFDDYDGAPAAVDMQPSTDYRLKFDYRIPSGSPAVTLVYFTSGGGETGSYPTYNMPSTATDTVHRFDEIITTPSDGAGLGIQFKDFPSGSHVTMVMVEPVGEDAADYADGETESWEWDGTRYRSTSTELDIVVGSGDGATDSTSDLTGDAATGRAVAGDSADSLSTVTAATATARAVAGDPVDSLSGVGGAPHTARSGGGAIGSSSDPAGAHATSRVGVGAVDSTSETLGEGHQLFGGAIDSGSDASGTGSGGHATAGATDSVSGGSADGSGGHAATGDTAAASDGDGDGSGGHAATGQTSSTSATTGAGFAKQLGAAGIIRPVVGLSVRLFDANGQVGEYAPEWTKVGFTDIYNETGTVTIGYPRDGLHADLLFADRAEGALFDGSLEIPATRFLVTQQQLDAINEDDREVALNCPLWVPTRLGEARVYPPGFPSPEQAKQQFANATPGAIMVALIEQAQARGAIGDVEYTFTADLTSDGAAWDQVVTLDLESGGSVLSALELLVEMGVCDWTCQGRELVLRNAESGNDFTMGSTAVVLRAGRDMLDAPEKRDASGVLTAVLVKGKDGTFVEVVDAEAEAAYGRLEGHISVSGVDDEGTLTVVGETVLKRAKLPKREYTHELSLFEANGPQPWVDYEAGDRVLRNIGDGTGSQPFLVRQLSGTYAQDGTVTAQVTLGDRFSQIEERLSRKIDALTNGSAGSAAPADDPQDDSTIPSVPGGLQVTSDAYESGQGSTFAAVAAAWNAVTTNTNGSTITDLSGYQVRWRPASETAWYTLSEVSDTDTSWSPVGAGVNIEVQVRARDSHGNTSDWSATVLHTTASDAEAPNVPTALSVSPVAGGIRYEWDGRGLEAGTPVPMPVDFKQAKVHLGTAAAFVPDDTTHVDNLTAAGVGYATGLDYGTTYFLKLVAVDHTGNESAPSDEVSATPNKTEAVDIGSVFADVIQAGILNAEVIVGDRIATAQTGRRVQLGFDGFKQFDANENLTSAVLPDGTTLITGELRSALGNERFVVNPNGTSPDEIRFYPDGNSQYGTIKTVTSMSEFFGAASGLSMKAFTDRADNFSGQAQVFPDYASMSWGETSIQTVPHQIGMGAPRLHIATFRNSDFDLDGDGEVMRFGTVDRNDPPDFINSSVIEYKVNATNEPYWRSFHWNSGVAFGNTYLGSINAASSGYIPHRASDFQVFTSTRDTKTQIEDLDYPGGPLAVLRGAKVQKWRRKADLAPPRKSVPGKPYQTVHPNPPPALVHVGPMADDLPPELTRFDSERGEGGYSVAGLTGLVHGGLNQLADLVDALEARVAALETKG